MKDTRWVVLIHEDYEKEIADYLRDPNKNLCIWHYEPIERYQQFPPRNPKWQFHIVVSGIDEACDYCDKQESVFIKDADEKAEYSGTLSSRYQIFKRDGFRCQLCGREAGDGVKLEVDHKLPKSLGGLDAADNLWTLCFDCNRGKSNRDTNA